MPPPRTALRGNTSRTGRDEAFPTLVTCHHLNARRQVQRDVVHPHRCRRRVLEPQAEIGQGAFLQCTSLSEITLPPTLTKIGRGAFCKCTSLSEITLPPNLTEIGRCAFYKCTSLSEITLPPNLAEIAAGVFCGCTSLSEITLPAGPVHIGPNAFQDCPGTPRPPPVPSP